MVTFKRLLLWFSLVIGVLGFLALAGELAEKERLIFGAVLLLLIIFLMGARTSSEINSSSIFKSRNSTALLTDSLEPLAAKEAKNGSADLSETPASETTSFKK